MGTNKKHAMQHKLVKHYKPRQRVLDQKVYNCTLSKNTFSTKY